MRIPRRIGTTTTATALQFSSANGRRTKTPSRGKRHRANCRPQPPSNPPWPTPPGWRRWNAIRISSSCSVTRRCWSTSTPARANGVRTSSATTPSMSMARPVTMPSRCSARITAIPSWATSVANGPLHYSATKDTKKGTIYLKMVNPKSAPKPVAITLKGAGDLAPQATAVILSAPSSRRHQFH